MNCQQTQSALTTQNSVAVLFKDVKSEEAFSSQDHKLVKLPICDILLRQKLSSMKTQGMSGSQDQKDRKTASTVTTSFFGQKITAAQIRFCND